jgi:acetyltransferase
MASIVYWKLLQNSKDGVLKADIYPVNPAHGEIGGQKCYATLEEIPSPPELLVIAVPASHSLELVRSASAIGVRAVVMITSGFAETGRRELQEELARAVREGGMRVLGPNTMGMLDMRSGVDTLFLQPGKKLQSGEEVASLLKPLRGGVVIVAQSGHLGEIITEELAANEVGIRALVVTGNQMDVSVEDIIGYFGEDDETRVIAVYLEGLRDGRRFMRVASSVARRKPIVVLKAGRTKAGASAALTHTASLVGNYEVYRAAFRECGVLEAKNIQELVDFCICFSLASQKPGKRLLIVTNAGGVGALAADQAVESGLLVERLRSATAASLRARFKDSPFFSNATVGNPLDLTASVQTADFADAASIALGAKEFDMGLVLPTHQAPAIDPSISTAVVEAIKKTGKAACVSVMGRAELSRQIHRQFILNGIPSYPTPDRAVRALAAYYDHSRLSLKTRRITNVGRRDKLSLAAAERGLLSPRDVRRVLAHYSVPQPRSIVLRDLSEIGRGRVRFPVACKLVSAGLPHKSDSGGVLLNVKSKEELSSSFSRLKKLAARLHVGFDGMLVQEMVTDGTELILGTTRDSTFGPTIAFGAGGTTAELFRDYAVAVAPVNEAQARDMVASTKVSRVLGGFRGSVAVDTKRLCTLISRFSRVLVENPSLGEAEINPLIANRDGFFAADARVVARQ